MNLDDAENFHDRPPLELVIRRFRAAKITSYVAAIAFTLLFVCIWPGSMLSIDILDEYGFNIWTTLSRGWAFVAATFIIIVPFYQEVRAIIRQFNKNKEDGAREEAERLTSGILQNGSVVPQTGTTGNQPSSANKHGIGNACFSQSNSGCDLSV